MATTLNAATFMGKNFSVYKMWCPDDKGRDGWDWVGPQNW